MDKNINSIFKSTITKVNRFFCSEHKNKIYHHMIEIFIRNWFECALVITGISKRIILHQGQNRDGINWQYGFPPGATNVGTFGRHTSYLVY